VLNGFGFGLFTGTAMLLPLLLLLLAIGVLRLCSCKAFSGFFAFNSVVKSLMARV
jgi:hypothetical protein